MEMEPTSQPRDDQVPLPTGEDAPTVGDRATTEPPADAPPADPYDPGWDPEDYLDHATAIGMDAGSLRRYVAPGREVLDVFGGPGVAELLEDHDLGALGDNRHVIEALGRFGDDLRTWRDASRRYIAGGGKAPDVPSLNGAALDKAVAQLMVDYVPDAEARGMLQRSGFLHAPAVKAMLEKMARHQQTYRVSLHDLDAQQRARPAQHDAQRERDAQARATPVIQGMSEAEFNAEYARVFGLWQAADASGQYNDKKVHAAAMERLNRARYGG